MYEDSGLEDLLIESDVYSSGAAAALLKGKSYKCGVYGHKFTMGALFRLKWANFMQWLSKNEIEIHQ